MKKIISILLSLLLVITMFSGCSSLQSQNEADTAINTCAEIIEAVYPVNTTVDIHTKKQADYLGKSSLSIPITVNGKKERSRPQAIEFEWIYNGNADANTEYVLRISEAENMENSFSYSTHSESIAVYNLKIATKYYWTVSANGETSSIFEFTTNDIAPRNLYVDGITNVRDLGGWVTENGTRTKQGLIFRCGRLNESSAETPNIEITESGIKTMRDELGIKTEIDVRKTNNGETGGIVSSPLGEDIAYYSCPMEWEGNTFTDNHDELLRVFEILSKQENYPIIFHCNIGTDRTGMIAFLINALLGVPEEDLFRDYLYSNFADIGGTRKIELLQKSGYYTAILNAEGSSLSEKTYHCLVDFGIPAEQLDSIIQILSEDDKAN